MPTGTLSYLVPPAHGLEVSVFLDGTTTVVVLRGEADIATLPIIVEALAGVIADNDGDVIVDLEETAFIDTGALRAVLRARQVLRGGDRQLTLRFALEDRPPAVGGLRALVPGRPGGGMTNGGTRSASTTEWAGGASPRPSNVRAG